MPEVNLVPHDEILCFKVSRFLKDTWIRPLSNNKGILIQHKSSLHFSALKVSYFVSYFLNA